MKRIILSKLTISGPGKPDAVLRFEEGLNVITGDSDTGKTFAFQCLDYILGADTEPKQIAEAEGYTMVSLVYLVDKETFEIQRTLGSHKVDIIHNGKTTQVPCKHDAANCNNLSRYLLSVIQEHDNNIFLKKNQNNIKRSLSFRDIVHLCMVKETDIIAESSSFQSIQYVEQTVRRSVLKYIITGSDDKDLEEIGDPAEINMRRAGVVEFLEKKKNELIKKISEIENNDNFQMYSQIETTKKTFLRISELRNEISKVDDEATKNQLKISTLQRKCFADEAKISEFQKLRSRYAEQLKENEIAATHTEFLSQLPHLGCPICRQTMVPELLGKKDREQLLEYFQTIRADLAKKLSDLDSVVEDLTNRLSENQAELHQLKIQNAELLSELAGKQRTLIRLNKIIIQMRQLDEMKKEVEIYRQELETIKEDIMIYSEKVARVSTKNELKDSSQYDEYCRLVETILKEWGFEDSTTVTFNSEKLDLYIAGKERVGWGKGYRAFIMSAMVIALMRYACENNRLHPGFVILDSPLVSLKERKKDANGEWVSDVMERKMIENILKEDQHHQVIIFENKDLQFKYDYNYVEFIHEGERKGFIPANVTNEMQTT